MTVAMYLARGGKEIPPQWKHDPTIYDNNGRTVAVYLMYKYMVVPQFWNLTKSEFKRLYKGD